MLFNRSFIIEIVKSHYFSIFIILLFHISGLIGLTTSSKGWFLSQTPLNLLLSFFVLIRHEDFKNIKLTILISLIFILSFFLEVLGTNTGLIFGNYHYGPVLGFGFFNTPIMIGINWFIMVFCIGVVLNRMNCSIYIKSLLGAAIMTISDYIIEPVAVAYNFWKWETPLIPIQNYISWFIFSYLFLLIFYKFKIESNNKVAPWLLMTQIIFFLTLNLLI